MLQEVPNYRNYRQQYGGNNRLRNLVIRCPAFQMGREGAPEYLCPPRCHRAEISFRLSGLHREHIQILKRVRRLLGCGTWDGGRKVIEKLLRSPSLPATHSASRSSWPQNQFPLRWNGLISPETETYKLSACSTSA